MTMAVHKVRKGLRLPIQGEPEQAMDRARPVSRVAVLADDYVGMRPTLQIAVGDDVRRGQLLFEDKKMPGVRYTAPAAGRVAAIHRGERRAFQSLVIELTADERSGRSGGPEEVGFRSFADKPPMAMTDEEVRDLLLESGLWTALRARPFSRTARPDGRPHSIFVTAIDTNPLAPDLDVVLAGRESDLERGLTALTKLTDGPVYVCTAAGSSLPLPALDRVRHERFSGPHPAGTVGVHIHTLDPVGRAKTVWHVAGQDVLAMGRLFATGRLDTQRVVSLAGPAVRRPRLVRTRLGAATGDLVADELDEGEVRVISGAVLSGRLAMGEVLGYVGRYHQQISVIREDRRRRFLGWLAPGLDIYSITPTVLSRLVPGKRYDLTTTTHGSTRAIVPIGTFEKVMPMDLEPTFLLKALAVGDVERAEQLGCLELDEEDLALCTFVCSGKNDYGTWLREVLATIEKEG
jgi:Na+-transporting NADH:ubiquinone oxidoreductase subunit A